MERITALALVLVAPIGCAHEPLPRASKERVVTAASQPTARAYPKALRRPDIAAITIMSIGSHDIQILQINGKGLDVDHTDKPQRMPVAPVGRLDRVFVRLNIDRGYEEEFHARFRSGRQYVIRGNPCSWLVVWPQGRSSSEEVAAVYGRVRFRTLRSAGQTVWFGGQTAVAPGETTAYMPWSNTADGIMCQGTPVEVKVYPSKEARQETARGVFALLHGESVTVTFDGSKKLRFSIE